MWPWLAEAWNAVFPDQPWTYGSAERDPWERGVLRARLDALVADLYGLSTAEFGLLLTGFPLLDRDQAVLEGDFFLTEGDERSRKGPQGERWDEVEGQVMELQPRSFITRDLALLTCFQRRKEPLPEDLEAWYRDTVGLDPKGPLSRFRIGKFRHLKERVLQAKKAGAVAYQPSGGGEEEEVV